MLVLGRKVGEKILIGDDVEVVILGVQGDKIRVGITAPDHVRVMRPEAKRRQPLETSVGGKALEATA